MNEAETIEFVRNSESSLLYRWWSFEIRVTAEHIMRRIT